jgi:hypothetical protein
LCLLIFSASVTECFIISRASDALTFSRTYIVFFTQDKEQCAVKKAAVISGNHHPVILFHVRLLHRGIIFLFLKYFAGILLLSAMNKK